MSVGTILRHYVTFVRAKKGALALSKSEIMPVYLLRVQNEKSGEFSYAICNATGFSLDFYLDHPDSMTVIGRAQANGQFDEFECAPKDMRFIEEYEALSDQERVEVNYEALTTGVSIAGIMRERAKVRNARYRVAKSIQQAAYSKQIKAANELRAEADAKAKQALTLLRTDDAELVKLLDALYADVFQYGESVMRPHGPLSPVFDKKSFTQRQKEIADHCERNGLTREQGELMCDVMFDLADEQRKEKVA